MKAAYWHGYSVACMLLGAVPLGACAAGPKLYDTGPGEDAAYIRFVNVTGQTVLVSAAAAPGRKASQLSIAPASAATEFMPVKPKKALTGRVTQGGKGLDIAPVAAAGELVSVIVWADGSSKLATEVVAELPKDFNGLKASVAFYNFDPGCSDAGLVVAGRGTPVFEKVAMRALQRRAVNPVAFKVQSSCGGQPVGSAIDLATLEAGQRYSIFLVASASGHQLSWVKDALSP